MGAVIPGVGWIPSHVESKQAQDHWSQPQAMNDDTHVAVNGYVQSEHTSPNQWGTTKLELDQDQPVSVSLSLRHQNDGDMDHRHLIVRAGEIYLTADDDEERGEPVSLDITADEWIEVGDHFARQFTRGEMDWETLDDPTYHYHREHPDVRVDGDPVTIRGVQFEDDSSERGVHGDWALIVQREGADSTEVIEGGLKDVEVDHREIAEFLTFSKMVPSGFFQI